MVRVVLAGEIGLEKLAGSLGHTATFRTASEGLEYSSDGRSQLLGAFIPAQATVAVRQRQ